MQKITCCPHLKLQHGESCGMELSLARKCTAQKTVHFWSDVGTEKKNPFGDCTWSNIWGCQCTRSKLECFV